MRKNSVQFFGLPGSGKTTLAKGLLHTFPERYIFVPSFSKTKRYYLAMLFIVRFPSIALYFLWLIANNRYKLWSYLLHLTSVAFASHMYVFLRKKENKIFLIDEGLLQRFLSVFPTAILEHGAQKMVSLLLSIHSLAVVVKGGEFDRFVYESDRMTSPRNMFGETYFKQWAENLTSNFNLLTAVLSEKDFVEVDNTGKKDAVGLTEELHEKITDIIG